MFKAALSVSLFIGVVSVVPTPSQAGGAIPLHVHVTGQGKVTSNDIPIDCGLGATKCTTASTAFKAPLEAEPAEGQKFLGWGGDCFLQGSTCLVFFDGTHNPINVTAKFSGGGGGTTYPETKCPPKCATKQLPDPHIREKNLKVLRQQ